MSTKRKAIVFDLEDHKKAKVQRTPHRVAHRNNAESSNDPQADFVSYMQPEILTLSFMLELLEKCHVHSSCLTGKSEDEIQTLFLEHVTPKPQRHYRATRVGKVLSAMQDKYGCSPIPDWQKQVIESSGSSSALQPRTNLASLLPATAASDRLKPPVESLINTERKIIKLGGGGGKVAAKQITKVKIPVTDKASDLDKIDLLLKPQPKKNEEKDLKVEISLNQSKRIITLNEKQEESTSKKLKTEETPLSNSSNCKTSASQNPASKHSSVSWP